MYSNLDTNKRKILFITGTRADFGKLKPLIRTIVESDQFSYQIFATGMHMLKRYGATINEIYKSGFSNIHTFINQDDVLGAQMDYVTANTITGLGLFVREFSPDLIVVHGDRVEALAGAIVGMLNNILVAHVEGGEVSGTVDELVRHAVSKMAHIHFVANKQAEARLLQMGEVKERIFIIGSPEIDIMLSSELPDLAQTKKYYEIDYDRYYILAYHPVTTELDQLKKNINQVVDAVLKSELNYIVIYPNNDKGSEVIFEAYEKLNGNPRFRILPSIRFEAYLTLLQNADACVGNSSSGVREAPVYGIPTVNIGSRQNNRSYSDSIVSVSEDSDKILNCLDCLPGRLDPDYNFGKGDSARKFLESLESDLLWQLSCQKAFVDLPRSIQR